MKNIYNRISQFRHIAKLPLKIKKSQINAVFSSFSKKEWTLFNSLFLVLVVSTVLILASINKSMMVSVPRYGGEIREGIVGAPRFINPVLAASQADLDLASLIYSGLMRKNPEGGLIPDLAEKYEVSKDGLSYTFTLKNNLQFHDGTPLTTDDLAFTISKVKDGVIKSPHKTSWDSISVETLDAKTIKFTLKQPDASFLESTTLGILPSHIWQNSPIELTAANTNPIGSGPYRIVEVQKQSSGIISYYELESFKKFALGNPYIKKMTLRFYPSEEDIISALEDGQVDQISSITPQNAKELEEKNYRVESSTLPRVFGLFFNQNQNQLFIDKSIVRSIDTLIDKERIVEEVLYGYGIVINSPIPPHMVKSNPESDQKSNISREEKLKNAEAELEKSGWTKGESGYLEKSVTENKKKVTKTLEFSISTGNAPELAQAANLIKEDLERVGMKVDVKTFEIGNLNQSVIRPRKYDVLLFGEIINHESDLYAFWHSSQRVDPGLNVSMYTNTKVDKILEDAFITIDEEKRAEKYAQFEAEIKKDMPAVFLYSPDFIYTVSKDLQGLNMTQIISPSNRFLSAHSWYSEVENVWKIFARN